VKVTLEILHWDGSQQAQVLHTLSHDCHSLETVRATIQAVIDSPDLLANGYRIFTDAGDEIYGFAQAMKKLIVL
jgi:hypothetical protein